MSESSHKELSEKFAAAITPVLAPGEIILGVLKDLDDKGNPLVDYDCNPDPFLQISVSTLAVTRRQLGRQVALLFAAGDLRRPVIMGFIHNPLEDLLDTYDQTALPLEQTGALMAPVEAADEMATVDGKKVIIEGQDEVVLRCGESSITLTKAGKIIIRGKYLLSRASGVNRILGGSVQVN